MSGGSSAKTYTMPEGQQKRRKTVGKNERIDRKETELVRTLITYASEATYGGHIKICN